MTDRELMQQALDALEDVADGAEESHKTVAAIEALRARLAQPEPEELGEIVPADEEQLKRIAKLVGQHPLWIRNEAGELQLHAPPQREWQGLTDDQIQQIEMSASSKLSAIYLAEAQLKGKNAL